MRCAGVGGRLVRALVVAAIVLAAVPGGPAKAQSITCLVSLSQITGVNGPGPVALADFNGDGKPDIATANFDGNSVLVSVGDGAGNFAPYGPNGGLTAVGMEPRSIAVGDFDRDGKLDFVTANQDVDTASVRLQRNGGSFATVNPDFAVGVEPKSVTVGDFNGDGFLDLAFAAYGADRVTVRLGNGAGGFVVAPDVFVGVQPWFLVAVDVNSDGQLDLAVANRFSDSVSILINPGFANFFAAPQVAVGNAPASIAIGDFNRDGKLDFATANASDNTVSVRLGDGSGGFPSGSTLGGIQTPLSIAVADVNGDGNQDLLMGTENGQIVLRLGNGSGGFTTPTPASYVRGGEISSIGVADLTGDGAVDVVAASYANNGGRVVIDQNGCDLNQAPTVAVPGPQTMTQGGTLTLGAASGTAIGVADPDIGALPIRVTVTAGRGVLTLSGTGGLTFGNGDGSDDATMTFTGPLGQVNAALNGLRYTPSANHAGPDAVIVTVNDLGGVGVDGQKTATASVPITVTQTQCPPQAPVRATSSVTAGKLQVQVAATVFPAQPNALRELRFGTLQNARVTVAGQVFTSGQTYTVPNGGAAAVDFTVERVTPGQPTTVPFTVVDACGEWKTFVGGGANAGF